MRRSAEVTISAYCPIMSKPVVFFVMPTGLSVRDHVPGWKVREMRLGDVVIDGDLAALCCFPDARPLFSHVMPYMAKCIDTLRIRDITEVQICTHHGIRGLNWLLYSGAMQEILNERDITHAAALETVEDGIGNGKKQVLIDSFLGHGSRVGNHGRQRSRRPREDRQRQRVRTPENGRSETDDGIQKRHCGGLEDTKSSR